MHPILPSIRKLIWYVLAWLGAGMLMAKGLVVADLAAWGNALFFSIPVALVFGFLASSAYYVCRSLPFSERRFYLVITLFGGTSIISGCAWLGICLLWNKLGRSLGESWSGITISEQLAILFFTVGCFFYLLSILAHDVLIAFENVRTAERRQAESQLLARDAELQVLRTQINPHFLFNSLNSISALTTIDPAGARGMTIELSNFFRQTLSLSEKTKITLGEEINLCNNFLAIEKIRFGEKLQVEMHIDPQTTSSLIPPMLLQPLVENAIKHGIRDLDVGGTIIIKSLAHDNWLHISIENPIDDHPSNTAGNGAGLKNLKARFNSLYGDNARVTWLKARDSFVVEMTVPLEYSKVVDD